MIPTINKPTRVTKKTTAAIDHIITNSVVENTVVEKVLCYLQNEKIWVVVLQS